MLFCQMSKDDAVVAAVVRDDAHAVKAVLLHQRTDSLSLLIADLEQQPTVRLKQENT